MTATPMLSGASAGTSGGGAPATLARARLTLHKPQSAAGGGAVAGPEVGSIAFQFNPKELTLTKSAKWVSEPARGARSAAPPEFRGAEPSKLALEMFFDAMEKQDSSVVDAVETLFRCCVPTAESAGQRRAAPPLVVFRWGAITGFTAYIASVSAKYTVFTASGVPVRATCTVTLQEMASDPARQNPTSGGLSVAKVHQMVAGDSLQAVAYREYGDPTLWRALAVANGIDDPLRLRSGTSILVPSPDEIRGLR